MKDSIDPQDFSLQYIKVDQVIRMVSRYGPGALVAKFDVEFAYRNIPVHPDDRFLLGMSWHGQFFIDLLLPFGLRSAPFIFNSVADMVEWILLRKHRLSDLLHYLDDFITAGPPQSSQCAYNLNMAISVCHRLGLSLHADKCVGPATSMTVLGIELDFVNQVACLPEDKLLALRELIHSWMPRRWCRKRELESLIAHLHHAAKVVWPWRAFLCRLMTYCAASVTRTIPFALTRNFVLICSGGSSFYLLGMELGSGCILACLLPQTWRSLRMQQVQLALVPILEVSGFTLCGQQCRPDNL